MRCRTRSVAPAPRSPGRLALAIAVAALGLGSAAAAEDWPEFRGPTGQGLSAETGLPVEWSEDRNVVWKAPVAGRGWSSPVVGDGLVWVTAASEGRHVELRALAFDTETGAQVRDVAVFELSDRRPTNPKNTYASPTPVLDEDRVYVHFGADGTAALSTAGEVLWRTRLPYRSQHGNGGSATLWRDLLVLSGDGSDRAFVVALERETGEERWRTPRRRPFAQAYSTPLAIRVDGQDQIVSVGAFRASAYEPETGREIWHVRYGDGFSNVPRPVFGSGLVFLSTGFQEASLLAVRPDGRGDVTASHVVWSLRRGAPHTPSPIHVGSALYVIDDGGVATCLDAASGQVHWRRRIGGNHSASPIHAEGRIYFQSEEGRTTVIAASTEYQLLAVNELDGATLASPAVSDGAIYLRSRSHLYRIARSDLQGR